jgi:hypothetical protein
MMNDELHFRKYIRARMKFFPMIMDPIRNPGREKKIEIKIGKAALDAEKKMNIKHKEACEQAGYGYLLPQIPLGFSPLLRIYAVLLLPMLLLLTDLMPMLFPSALDMLVLLYKKGWPTK